MGSRKREKVTGQSVILFTPKHATPKADKMKHSFRKYFLSSTAKMLAIVYFLNQLTAIIFKEGYYDSSSWFSWEIFCSLVLLSANLSATKMRAEAKM